MQTSTKGIELIKKHEGLRLTAYKDVGGLWTIGYGHLLKLPMEDYFLDNPISEEVATTMLKMDLFAAERALELNTVVPLTQNQFDALVSFIFNVGGRAYRDSTLLRYLNEGNYAAAADQLLRWDKVGGKSVKGLANRRAAERTLFLS